MSKIVRALLLSALATGVAAVVVNKMQEKDQEVKPAPVQRDPFEVQADTLSEGEVKRLTDELGTML